MLVFPDYSPEVGRNSYATFRAESLSIGDPRRPQVPAQKVKTQQTRRKSENRDIVRMLQNFFLQHYEKAGCLVQSLASR